ncbi:hypothetical protein KY343_01115 [Candidatus Woesearchaeota archaeon]|nr:hypothetical protein [Candidatus Woesearchaeota archaeon]
MTGKRVQSLAKRLQVTIENLVQGSYKEIEKAVQSDYDSYQRQIDTYKRKAQTTDIAISYLKNGTQKVSVKDKNKVGPTYAKKLEQVVAFNVKYKNAREGSKKVPGLNRQIKTLEAAKTRLQSKYDREKKTYETRITNLQKKYAKAEFIKRKIAELRVMSLSQYQGKMKTDASEKAFLRTTYYNNKPTDVTYILEDTIAFIRTKNNLQLMKEIGMARISAIREGKDPDEAQKAIEAKNKPKKAIKKAKKKKK